ncbi:hypothetical protein ACFE04_025126 [Oxalis oulophora]
MEISSSLTCSISRPSLPLSSSHSNFFSCNLMRTQQQQQQQQQSSIALRTTRSRSERRKGFSCKALFGLGVPELVVIAGVAALVFGPKKLPEVGRSIGKTVKSFQEPASILVDSVYGFSNRQLIAFLLRSTFKEAAKEFETELKKDSDSPAESQGEQLTSISEEKKQDANVSSSEKSV